MAASPVDAGRYRPEIFAIIAADDLKLRTSATHITYDLCDLRVRAAGVHGRVDGTSLQR